MIYVTGAGKTQETGQQVGVPNGFCTKAEDYRRCWNYKFAGLFSLLRKPLPTVQPVRLRTARKAPYSR
jgi:hypothetical protein